MNFIGVDLHKKSITVRVMDEKRKVLARKTLACTQADEIVEFCRQFRPFKVVVEATASYVWFVELVEPLAEQVVLANPKKLRVIAESTKETDRLDAQVLTEFLVLDMIPESYQPTPRQHRALVRHRQYLQGRITSVRSKIRHILSNSNADRKDLFSANCGLAYLEGGRLLVSVLFSAKKRTDTNNSSKNRMAVLSSPYSDRSMSSTWRLKRSSSRSSGVAQYSVTPYWSFANFAETA